MSRQPIKRHSAIQPISRDHHQSLLLGWKIRTGLRYQVTPDRIYKYLKWFYTNYLIPHFAEEETYLFPILGESNEQVIKAKAEHIQIHDFFEHEKVSEEDIFRFEELLVAHVRFEERELFNMIQDKANDLELEKLSNHLVGHVFIENVDDEFWLAENKNLKS